MKRYSGLTSRQVLESRARHGDNVLTPPRRASLWSQFIGKFNDPLIKILLVALALSVGLSVWEYARLGVAADVLLEPVGIFVAVVLATTVGFAVEVNANKKFELLNKSNDDLPVTVVRDGGVRQVPRRDVVVGDVVMLNAGDRVPADGTLLHSVALSVDESTLTGEPQAWKTHNPSPDDSGGSAYAANQMLRGSTVMEGNGVMRVDRVGDATEYGQVATGAQIDSDVETPLMQQLDRLGRLIARASYIIAALIVVGRALMFWLDDGASQDGVEIIKYAVETVMVAVTLIVVSVPEGLPMSITLSLALSMHRMLRTGNLVRRLHACETMGATTVICTDKTGTLTQNQMRVAEIELGGSGNPESVLPYLASISLACNSTAHLDDSDPAHVRVVGNPTEGALLLWLREHGVDYMALREQCTVESQVPFSTERKYMSTVLRTADGRRVLLLKGAPELVAAHCGIADDALQARIATCQQRAMRTLAFALAELADGDPVDASGLPPAGTLRYVGYVAISDPVRPDVPGAIAECRRAGVRVIIVTGDNAGTAREVARQVGIWADDDSNDSAMITGAEFAALTDEQAIGRIGTLKVMSRARPADKARLVELLQRSGEVVAVTGDGTNDAPALKKAQVGLSMGDGTQVAREASDITILDNSFASINRAVLWGRSLYRNIQRFIVFQLTVNVCACAVVGVCSFINKQPALTVTQMLWVNLIMDTFAALALASLPPSDNVMRDAPRRRGESIITPAMWRFIAGVGGAMAVALTAMFAWLLLNHTIGEGGSVISQHITPGELAVFFTTFVMLQFWNLFNARAFASGHSAFYNVRGSTLFWAVAAVILLGQVAIVQFAAPLFSVEPLEVPVWLAIVGTTSLVLWAGELWRLLRAR